jgi:hypothetical protein
VINAKRQNFQVLRMKLNSNAASFSQLHLLEEVEDP